MTEGERTAILEAFFAPGSPFLRQLKNLQKAVKAADSGLEKQDMPYEEGK
jgi:hypothetical protein